MTHQPDSMHPKHPHNLECPHCKQHNIVVQGEDRYVCLNCGWSRDLNDWYGWWGEGGTQALLVVATTGFIIFLLFLDRSKDLESDRNTSLLLQPHSITELETYQGFG